MIVFAPEAIEQMVATASRELPREAVGFLAGNANAANEVVPLEHIGDHRSFLVLPQSQFLAQREIRDRGLEIVAVFHSHPDGGTSLSPEDIAFGAGQPWPQVVLAFPSHDPAAWRLGVWRVQERQVHALEWAALV